MSRFFEMPDHKTSVLVCGSRDWSDKDAVANKLADLAGLPAVEIIHGGARGADSMADEIARLYGFSVRVFPADWNRYGRRAGFLRNLEMLDQRPNLVIAFQRNASRGTQHTINEARKRGIPVEVVASV
jgi:hypothetical protein